MTTLPPLRMRRGGSWASEQARMFLESSRDTIDIDPEVAQRLHHDPVHDPDGGRRQWAAAWQAPSLAVHANPPESTTGPTSP
ncbi:hypothetical protein [Micromonospora sp. DT233]|uniref:hypothetical protein n=1 Tax=Micromonospora sp. DT233 TaxID=3393432 RepID=UPI003CEB3891